MLCINFSFINQIKEKNEIKIIADGFTIRFDVEEESVVKSCWLISSVENVDIGSILVSTIKLCLSLESEVLVHEKVVVSMGKIESSGHFLPISNKPDEQKQAKCHVRLRKSKNVDSSEHRADLSLPQIFVR